MSQFKICPDERLKFYIGTSNSAIDPPTWTDTAIADIPFRTDIYFENIDHNYVVDIKRYQSYVNKPFWVQCGDCSSWTDYPVLCKIRDTKYQGNKLATAGNNTKEFVEKNKIEEYNGSGVIANLNSARHWGFVSNFIKDNISWNNKKNEVIWRGVSTGIHQHSQNYNRLNLVKDYWNKYDVGFSGWVQQHCCPEAGQYVKGPVHPFELSSYKYIIAIDGNDKSSAINWILASNCVPIMPKPRFHSWLCEPWLKNKVHYVEVKEDFSDLDEQMSWCKDNDDKCKEIAYNGKAFMLQNFSNDQDIEKELMEIVVNDNTNQ